VLSGPWLWSIRLARGPAAEEPAEWHRAMAPGVEVGEITTQGLALSRLKHGFESRREGPKSGATSKAGSWPTCARRISPRCARHSAQALPVCDGSRGWPSRFCVMPGWRS